MKLVVDEFVSVNHYLAYRCVKKGNRMMAMSYKTKEAINFQKKFTNYVKEEVKKQNWIYDGNPFQHYYVDAVYYFPRVDMDCNNYWKVTFDAITDSGLVWVDDNMACERVNGIYYDSKHPRIEYTIYKTDFTGIFDNENCLNDFENKCKSCKRYSRNCSILKKAKEGRIQDEIVSYNCKKYKGS